MFRWLPYPFIRILIFFIAGIVCGINIPFTPSAVLSIGILTFIFLLFLITSRVKAASNYFISGLSACLLISFLGFLHVKQNLPDHKPDEVSYLKARVNSYPEEKEKYNKYEATLQLGGFGSDSLKPLNDKILLYVAKDYPLDYGDIVFANTEIYPVNEPRNPEEFNYKKYLYYKGINGQAFVQKDKIIRIDHGRGNGIVAFAFEIRARVDNSIDNYFQDDTAPIIKALLVGIRSDMDDELKTSYAAAGAVHVLAVSGLHVGIFYGLILWSFGWLKNTRKGKAYFAGLALALLWLYALVTGFPPSILRAVLMFSFIIVAQATNRGSGIYNAIAGSAFILLSFDPLLLMNVGFQLSYMAVIGIVYLYPRLIGLWEFNNPYIDRVWQMSVVGIAAQIGTFPIALFYFHQFPTYFLLSNLIVIPAATLILCLGMFFLAVQWWVPVAAFVSTITSWVINIMNYSVQLISKFPYSTINEIFISPVQLFLLTLCVLFFIAIFVRRNVRISYAFYLVAAIFIVGKFSDELKVSNDELIHFYSIDKSTNIDFVVGRTVYNYQTTRDSDNAYFLKSERDKRHARLIGFPEKLKATISDNELLSLKNKKVLILRNKDMDLSFLDEIDFLLIENDALRDIENLETFQNKKILIGTTNSTWFRNKIFAFASERSIEILDLNKGSVTFQL